MSGPAPRIPKAPPKVQFHIKTADGWRPLTRLVRTPSGGLHLIFSTGDPTALPPEADERRYWAVSRDGTPRPAHLDFETASRVSSPSEFLTASVRTADGVRTLFQDEASYDAFLREHAGYRRPPEPLGGFNCAGDYVMPDGTKLPAAWGAAVPDHPACRCTLTLYPWWRRALRWVKRRLSLLFPK